MKPIEVIHEQIFFYEGRNGKLPEAIFMTIDLEILLAERMQLRWCGTKEEKRIFGIPIYEMHGEGLRFAFSEKPIEIQENR